MNKIMSKICFAVLATFLVACSSVNTAPEKTYYVLKNNAPSAEISGTPHVSIRGVKLPDYLNQRGIARQLPNGQVNVSYTDLWAEKLSKSVPTLLAEHMSAQLLSPVEQHPLPPGVKVGATVDVHITRFIGTPTELRLRAGYRIIRTKKMTTYTFATTVALQDNQTSTLVNAYEIAIARLAQDIAKHF